MPKIAVIGGGAAGLIAAGTAAYLGADVTLFERNKRLGTKLMITGKGRCNVTNNSPTETVLSNIPTNPRFLYAALNAFSTADTIDFFENLGVPLKTERGARVFPVSDKAADIVSALKSYISGVKVINRRVTKILTDGDSVSGVRAVDEDGNSFDYGFDKVILCTGGVSYPRTGSTGDGYRLSRELGHSIIPPTPSLVPLEADKSVCAAMSGLSLKNVTLTICDKQTEKTVYSEFGEMLFAHFGITGPVVLSASAHLKPMTKNKYRASIDLKPALDEKTLDSRLLSDFSKYTNKNFSNSLSDLLPQKMIPVFIKKSGIDPYKKVNEITKEERRVLVGLFKSFSFDISGFRPIDEAIITSGGINVKEISPKDMQSKIVRGLYFAGEVIDVDAYTGGFNLQIAFSTGYLAGTNAALDN